MNSKEWDTIIENKSALLNIDIKEVWRYRDLLAMYVKRDIITFYKQTILGPLWFVIQPLFTTIMFMFVFGGIAGISTDGIPQAVFLQTESHRQFFTWQVWSVGTISRIVSANALTHLMRTKQFLAKYISRDWWFHYLLSSPT